MVLFPRWTKLWTGSPFLSPPQEFTRQQPKIFHRQRSQDNTPGRQFSLKLTTMTITMHDGISDWFVMHFGRFPNSLLTGYLGWYFWCISDISEKRGSSLLENHKDMASRYDLRQFRDFYVYELQNIEREIARLGGITRFQTLKQTGGDLARFQYLFSRREFLLDQIRTIEPQIGLNVYIRREEN